MSDRLHWLARGISAFVENPFTNLFKGLALFVIGLSEVSRTFHDDLAHGRFRVGHGLVIIGLFSILSALPHFIEGLEASRRFLELQDKKARPDSPPSLGADDATTS
jgi:hypothetical protein